MFIRRLLSRILSFFYCSPAGCAVSSSCSSHSPCSRAGYLPSLLCTAPSLLPDPIAARDLKLRERALHILLSLFQSRQSKLLISILLFCWGIGITPASAKSQLTLMLDWFISPHHAPIIIAQEKGYFSEEALQVKILLPIDPSSPPKMAAAGQVDLAISYQPQHHLQIAEGLPLKRVGTLIEHPLACILTLKKTPINRIADLAGRKIGLSVAGVEEPLLSFLLKQNNLSLKDITLVNAGWSLAYAVMSGHVDAAMGAFRNFEIYQMQVQGIEGKCLNLEDLGVPDYNELIYVANLDMVDISSVRKFLKATERAVLFISENPEESWRILKNRSPDLQGSAYAHAWASTISYFAKHPAALNHVLYAQFESFLHSAGLLSHIRPVSSLAVDLEAE